jgi:hypothetical protein
MSPADSASRAGAMPEASGCWSSGTFANKMKLIPDREAEISCGILSIWVLRRQFPDSADYWDGNWLDVVAHCSDQGAAVTVSGSILHLGEVEVWMKEMEEMDRSLKGTAKLPTIEPNLSVALECNERGQITATCHITPDQLTQTHEFIFPMDQSYLKGIISQCRKVLSAYELRDPHQKI